MKLGLSRIHPLLRYHFILVEGFVCPNDPRSQVVWGLMSPKGLHMALTGPGELKSVVIRILNSLKYEIVNI